MTVIKFSINGNIVYYVLFIIFVVFDGLSTFVGYLMPKASL